MAERAFNANNPMTGDHRPAEHRPEPPASVRAQRPPLAADTRSAFAQTNENLDAQNAWLAHIAAGRIEVKADKADTPPTQLCKREPLRFNFGARSTPARV